MLELLALGFLLLALLVLASVGLVVLKAAIWIVLLPFRLLFWLLLLPLLMLKAALGVVAVLVAGPILALTLLAGAVAAVLALLVPLLPLLAIGLLIWLIVRAGQRPVVAG